PRWSRSEPSSVKLLITKGPAAWLPRSRRGPPVSAGPVLCNGDNVRDLPGIPPYDRRVVPVRRCTGRPQQVAGGDNVLVDLRVIFPGLRRHIPGIPCGLCGGRPGTCGRTVQSPGAP